MGEYRLKSRWFLATFMVALVAGCGQETINVPDTTAPYVISTVPAQAASGVPLNTPISATFSEAVQAGTISTASFTVASPTAALSGTVALSGNTATFTPSGPLLSDTVYIGTITTAVKDLAGNPMVQNYVWQFETTEIPSISSTTPANGATGVAITSTASATFVTDPDSPNAAINCPTLTTTTFTISSPAGPVAGAVTCSGATALFTPAALLTPNTTYTATVTTGAHNLAGNGLAAPYVWTFTTGAQPAVISTTPANGATGVPTDQVISATFSELMNCATLYTPATSFTVTGPGVTPVAGVVNCAGNVATFTPSALLAANTLYTAAISAAASDPAGEPLAGNYTWTFKTAPAITPPTVISTDPLNNAVGVPVNQKLAATFSEAMDPASINATTFTLTGPGGVAVTGVVAYVASGSTATFSPAVALAPNTTYVATITTGAQDLSTPPNSLAANYVWTFTTGTAPDTTRPMVISTIPADGDGGVAVNRAISATFNKAMDPATLTAASFTVTGPGSTAVAGLVSYSSSGDTATFTPLASLPSATLFTATITTMAADLSGNALASNYVWTFTTAAAFDVTHPAIVSTNPVDGASAVPVTATINATFSKAMDPMTLTPSTFQLSGPGGVLVGGRVAYDSINFIATFLPNAALAYNTTYVASVSSSATDLSGNTLGPGFVPNPWSFTTAAMPSPPVQPPPAITPPIQLGSIVLFAAFGGDAGVTNQGTLTAINGDVGTTGVSSLITGLHDAGSGCSYGETAANKGLVNGTIYTAPPPAGGCTTEGTAATAKIAAQAELDALAAWADLVAFPGGLDVSTCAGCGGGSPGELGGRTLGPGIYQSATGSYSILNGDLTLDAKGDPNAFWVFQMSTSLTVGTPGSFRNVILINGAQSKNVFWQAGTAAAINGVTGGGTMVGTIIAPSGITISISGVGQVTTLDGRAIALHGPVSFVNTVINVPAP
ncbi:MAG TPA: Ig-like domain-containing protein [Acidisarcina sp.]